MVFSNILTAFFKDDTLRTSVLFNAERNPITNFFVREMFLDSSLLSFDVIGVDGGVDTVGDGGNEGVATFEDDPDIDNDTDDVENDQKEDDDDWESNDAAATDVVNVVIDKYGGGDNDTDADFRGGSVE